MTVCECWSGRDSGERTQQEALADRTGASSRGTFGWPDGGRLPPPPSGREWQGAQSGQGTIELGFPRPALWQMQCEAARRAGDPSGQGEEPPPEGLGGHHLLAQTDARCPAGDVVGHHLYRCTASQAALAAKRPEGRWFNPTPCLRSRMAFSISAWRRWSASSSSISPSRSVMKP